MSTISGTGLASASVASVQAAAQSALQEAAQSIIAGSTGNSSLDVSSLVTALVSAKTAGQTAALTTEADNDNTQISALGQLSAALSALQVGLAPLYGGSLLTSFTATTSGTGITATAGTGAVAGTYSVDVSQVATAQSITSQAFDSTDAAALGTGTLNVSVGSSSMSLDITSANDTLSDVASAINSSDDNPGISATVVNGTDGAHLVLSSTATGAANTINVSVTNASSTSAPLNDLAVTTTPASDSTAGSKSTISGTGWTQSADALDAEFTINGTAATSATNTVTTALNGVTLNLTAAAIDTSGTDASQQTLTVAADTTTQATDIENFVSDYNAVVSTISTLTSFDSTASAGSQGGPLLGDSTVNIIQSALGGIVSSAVNANGVTANLSNVGITLNSDGTLSLDTTTLNTALQNDPSQVSALFNLTNGVGEQLNSSINVFTQSNGILAQRTAVFTSDLQNVTTQSNALTAYAAQLTSQYSAEFTSLDTLMANTQSDSEYLTQLFGGADSAGALASATSE